VFAPSTSADAVRAGDVERGEAVFEQDCAGCHGEDGTGGAGPALFETGLDATEVATAVQQGRGVMPAGIVTGQEQADVVAYVVSISSPTE
jgi:mono/diheme cytochrome c family protein